MATDFTDDITYVLETAVSNSHFLGSIRHWSNLKAAVDGEMLWLRDITRAQAESVAIESIPFKTLYYQRENLLFVKGSLLPLKKIKSTLLWSPLDRVLPVSLPPLNHNFFGIDARLAVTIKNSSVEQTPVAMLAEFGDVKQYIESAPKVRLQNLSWIRINDRALLLGTPLLPVKAQSYWQTGTMLFPTGYDLEFPVLHQLVERQIDPSGTTIILWQPDGSYVLVSKCDLKPLSISSFRLTYADTV